MSENINWKGIENALLLFASAASTALATYGRDKGESSVSTNIDDKEEAIDKNPILVLPYEVRESMTSEFYEPAMSSILERYILSNMIHNKNRLQELMIGLFKYATRKNSHVIEWNTIVVLSELPYEELGDWADALALTATRSQYMDVAEIGIRCFENWENIEACEFLKNCKFEEKWLQEYANQVYAYVTKEGWRRNVLSTEDYSWEVAERIRTGSKDEFDRYSSRYGTS